MTFLFLILLILLVIVLFNRINIVTRKVEQLEKDVKKLRETSFAAEPRLSKKPETQPATAKPAAASPPDEISIPVPVQQTPEKVQTQQPDTTTRPERQSRSRAEWEALVGGKLLNRIGALALIFGVGFFLKYAFDNNWINETMRVLIGFLTGAVLLFGSARFQKKDLPIFAQGLAGAGISILYLSVYASFNFYHLVSQAPAFLLMSIVTVLAFWQAIKFDSLAVSALGWAGGYLTPFLLSTGQANEIGLFTYIVLLEAGLLAILLKKEKWVVLELLTVLATYAVFFAWFIEYYDENELLLPMFFLSLFWAIFYAFDIIQHLRSVSLHQPLRIISAAGNAAFYYACVYILLYPKYFDQAGAVTLGIGLVYFLTVFILKNKIANAWAVLSQYTVTAIALLVFATAIQFSGFTIITLWSLEALLLVLCSVRWPLAYVRNAALVLFVVAAIALLNMRSALAYQPIEDFSLIFNARFLAFATLGLALGTSAYVLRQKESAGTPQMITLLQIGCCLVFLVLFTVETLDIFEKAIFRLRQQSLSTGDSNEINQLRNLQQLTLSGVWLFYSIILMAGGLWSRIQGLRFAAIALFGISILKVFIYDLSYLDTLYRIFSFIGLGVILLGVSYLYQRYKILLFEK